MITDNLWIDIKFLLGSVGRLYTVTDSVSTAKCFIDLDNKLNEFKQRMEHKDTEIKSKVEYIHELLDQIDHLKKNNVRYQFIKDNAFLIAYRNNYISIMTDKLPIPESRLETDELIDSLLEKERHK